MLNRTGGLSVVVANRARSTEEVEPAVRALQDELVAGVDQLVWVDAGGIGAPAVDGPAVVPVAVDPGADRGTCYGIGLTAADRELVAFTDSTTVVAPGWRASLTEAVAAGAGVVVGGPVAALEPRSRCSWAGFLVDYGTHAVAPFTSATGDVPGNNVAYHRRDLPNDGRPLWKSAVDARLRRDGSPATVVPGMAVTVARRYRCGDLVAGRFRAGALYGSQRAEGWPAWRRWSAATGCPALPALALWRLWRRLRPDAELGHRLLRCLPEVLLGLGSWSAGEAAGYLGRRGSRTGDW